MIKYAKIINEQTGLCEVGIGTDSGFYESIGMSQMDVLQSEIDNQWYITEKCPQKAYEQRLEEAKKSKIQEINVEKEKTFKAGIVFNNERFDCDDRAQTRLLFQATQIPAQNLSEQDKIVWLDYDYKPVELSVAEFVSLCSEATAVVSGIEFKTGQLFESVEAASTIEELAEIIIEY